jgi:hypothetical protein
MNYLVIEGYTAAAEEFSKEAEIKDSSHVDFNLIENRMNIKRAVHRGDIKEAIEKVNDLNPEVRASSFYYHTGLSFFMHHSESSLLLRILEPKLQSSI